MARRRGARKGPIVKADTKAGRVRAREKLGKLSMQLVQPGTLKRYKAAFAVFLFWLRLVAKDWPADVCHLDDLACEWIDTVWCEGEPRSLVGLTLSAIYLLAPAVKGQLPAAWRLHSQWGAARAA